jgi:hypothetical protein
VVWKGFKLKPMDRGIVMLSAVIILLALLYIAYVFIDVDSNKKNKIEKTLNFEEQRFFISLAESLPPEFTVAYQSDMFDIRSIAKNLNINKTTYRKFKKLLSNRAIDFVILDKNFDICCIVDFTTKKTEDVNKDFIDVCNNLDIPVFKYYQSEQYSFSKLKNHLEHL